MEESKNSISSYEKNKEYIKKYHTRKYNEDPEYKQKIQDRISDHNNKKYNEDPKYKEYMLKKSRDRYKKMKDDINRLKLLEKS